MHFEVGMKTDNGYWLVHGRKTKRWPGATESEGDDHRFGFQIRVQGFAALLATPARLLVAAKWQRRVEHIVAVHPDGAGAKRRCHAMCSTDVATPDCGGEAVVAVVGAAYEFRLVVEGLG